MKEKKMFVTHVQSYGSYLKVFGQINKNEAVEVEIAIRTITPTINQHPAVTLKHIQQTGETMMLAKSNVTSDYYRCKLLKLNSNGTIDVLFIDYGKEATIPINEVSVTF